MLNSLEFKNDGKKGVMDVNAIIGAIAEKESTPHDKEDLGKWSELYRGICFFDDVYGYMQLDKRQVIAARKLEMGFFRRMGVYTRVPRAEAKAMGCKVITTKWMDANKR